MNWDNGLIFILIFSSQYYTYIKFYLFFKLNLIKWRKKTVDNKMFSDHNTYFCKGEDKNNCFV